MRVIFNIVACLLLIETVAGQCSLCREGSSSLIDPSAKLGPSTCAQMEASLSSTPSVVCNAMVLSTNFYFDYSAFCCSDVNPSTPSCDICGPGRDILQENVQTPQNNLVSTCGEAKLAATYSESSASCNILQEAGFDCCDDLPPTGAPTPPPTVAPTAELFDPLVEVEEEVEEEEPAATINAAEEQYQSAASGVSFMAAATLGLVLSSFV